MKRTVIPLLLIAAIAFFLVIRQKTRTVAPKHKTSSMAMTSPAAANTSRLLSPQNAEASSKVRPTKPQESLKEMSLVLKAAFSGSKSLNGIVSLLKQTQQNPVVTRDANPATGEMLIIRTNNPLPGTRYFHAQYFTDSKKQRYVQHMSFEFKPSPTALKEAVQAAVQNFSVGEPSQRGPDFIQWDLDDDYILWVKRKSAKDLTNDPFNAHDPKKDVGTVQMALEMKIHHDEH